MGVNAGDILTEAVLAIEMGATARDLGESIHPHPTLSETIGNAAEAFLARPPRSIGLARRRRPTGSWLMHAAKRVASQRLITLYTIG